MNTAEKKYSERELVIEQRVAARQAVAEVFRVFNIRAPDGNVAWEGSAPLSERLFPLPKDTRPRVATDPDDGEVQWSVQGGKLCFSTGNGWRIADQQWHPLPERVAVWADLFANPTEEVEDEL